MSFFTDPFLSAVLRAADEDAWVKATLNGVELFLPAGTLLTLSHCAMIGPDGSLHFYVETHHLNWMKARMKPGSVFLDIGASTGAMTLPLAKELDGIQIFAFEPATRARRLLTETLTRNDITGVKVISAAVSDRDGYVTFAERPLSVDHSVPFLPETSTIVGEGTIDSYGGEIRKVAVRTIDTIVDTYGLASRHLVIKIDIEGYEEEALRGGATLLRNSSVSLAIDIHAKPGGGGETTEAGCRSILEAVGYHNLSMLGHVLICER